MSKSGIKGLRHGALILVFSCILSTILWLLISRELAILCVYLIFDVLGCLVAGLSIWKLDVISEKKRLKQE